MGLAECDCSDSEDGCLTFWTYIPLERGAIAKVFFLKRWNQARKQERKAKNRLSKKVESAGPISSDSFLDSFGTLSALFSHLESQTDKNAAFQFRNTAVTRRASRKVKVWRLISARPPAVALLHTSHDLF